MSDACTNKSDPPTMLDELESEQFHDSEHSNSLASRDDGAELKKRRVEYRRNVRDYVKQHGHALCPFCTGVLDLSNAKRVDTVVIDLVGDNCSPRPLPEFPIPIDDPVLSSQRIALRWLIVEIEVAGRSHPIWRRVIEESTWKDGDGSVLRGEENMYMETLCFTEM